MKTTKPAAIFRAAFFALAFSACNALFEPAVQAVSAEGDTVKVRVSANRRAARSVLPDMNGIITWYELWGTKSGGTEYFIDWSYDLDYWEEASARVVEIPVGTWKFYLEGYYSPPGTDDALVKYEGVLENVNITRTFSGPLNFTLAPLNWGTGNVSLYTEFPIDADVAEVVTTIDGTEIDPPLDINPDTELGVSWFVLEDTWDTGDYLVTFTLKNAAGQMMSVINEIVVVRGNVETWKEYYLTDDDLNGPPKTPENAQAQILSASDSTGDIRFTWSDPSGRAAEFTLNNGATDTALTTGVTSTNGLYSYTLNSASFTNSYKIKASNNFGESPWSALVTPKPGIPANVTTTVAVTPSVTVSWDAVAAATGYNVYRSPASDGTYIQIASVTGISYTDTGVSSQNQYYYKVSALISSLSLEGDLSAAVSASTMDPPPTIGSALTIGEWKDSTVAANSTANQYYYFYATAGTFYRVHWNDGYQGDGTKNATLTMYITAYWYSDNDPVFSSAQGGYTYGKTFTADKSGYVILRAYPYSSSSSVRSYAIIVDGNPANTELVPVIGSALTNGQWKDDTTIVNSSVSRYYYFYAAQDTPYTIRWNDAYQGDGTKNASMYITAYWYKDGSSIFSSAQGGYTYGQTFTAYQNGYVILRASPYTSYSPARTYAIITTAGTPIVHNPPSTGSLLASGQWTDGTLSSAAQTQYYYFFAYQGNSYSVYWNDSYAGNGTKTCDIKVSAYWETDSSTIFSQTDSAWSFPSTFTATRNGYVILKVQPYASGSTGNYAILYQ